MLCPCHSRCLAAFWSASLSTLAGVAGMRDTSLSWLSVSENCLCQSSTSLERLLLQAQLETWWKRKGSTHSVIKSAAPAVSSCCLTELKILFLPVCFWRHSITDGWLVLLRLCRLFHLGVVLLLEIPITTEICPTLDWWLCSSYKSSDVVTVGKHYCHPECNQLGTYCKRLSKMKY